MMARLLHRKRSIFLWITFLPFVIYIVRDSILQTMKYTKQGRKSLLLRQVKLVEEWSNDLVLKQRMKTASSHKLPFGKFLRHEKPPQGNVKAIVNGKRGSSKDSAHEQTHVKVQRRPWNDTSRIYNRSNIMNILNPHPFNITIDPGNICSEKLDLFMYVHTAPKHIKHRMMIRNGWANQKYYKHARIRVLFILGSAGDISLQQSLQKEAKEYGDILQENFVDSYTNLTYKTVAALKYYVTHCSHVPHVLKTDDDVFVNMYSLMWRIKRIPKDKTNYLMCMVFRGMRVQRSSSDKWFLSVDDFPEDRYPPYCSGSAWVASADAATSLYHASFRAKFFWIDDVFMTGIVGRIAKVNFIQIEPHYKFDFQKVLKLYSTDMETAMRKYYVTYRASPPMFTSLWEKVAEYVKRNSSSIYAL